MTIAQLTHGVFRARVAATAHSGPSYIDELCAQLVVHPVDKDLAALVGRIEGESAAQGIAIDLADLIIGPAALYTGSSLLTLNPRHFQLIPGLTAEAL